MRKVSIISAAIYVGTALFIAGLFLLGTVPYDLTEVDRIGGAVWVFILSIIILMPIVISQVKKRVNI